MSVESLLVLLVLLAGFASQGGRATVTYQPTSLKGDGQGCPSDEKKAQAIENFHNLIEERVERASTPETRLLTELNTAVETLNQEVAEISNNSQTVNGTINELREEMAELSNYTQSVTIVLSGLNEDIPADSCQQIIENQPDLLSGNYWIRNSNGTAVQVYCDMTRRCCNETTGAWTRVANLDMTDPNQQCPPEWTLITSPVRTCGRTSNGSCICDSVTFPANGATYSRVCGRVRAYQVGGPDAFYGYDINQESIDDTYVAGISITHGSTPRQHVWSFAAAWSEIWNGGGPITCRCTNTQNPQSNDFLIPLFVDNDYFCETGTTTAVSGLEFFSDDPLWDGEGCGPTSTCCELNNPPWFCKQLPAPTSDDIEVRLCLGEEESREDIAVEQIEIYIL